MYRRLTFFTLLALAAFALAACGAPAPAPTATTAAAAPTADPKAGWPKEFRVGLFGGDDAEKTLKGNELLRVRLEKGLGIPVKLTTGTSYSAVIEAMRNDKVDAMEVGPFSYVLAVQEANAEALAVSIAPPVTKGETPKKTAQDTAYYYSTIITKKGSGIKTLQDLKGKDFSFVDPASTSGHLMPKTSILKAGIDPDKDMKTIFAGSHPSSVIAVWNSKVAAGATFEGNLVALAQSNQIDLCGFDKQNIRRTPEELAAKYDTCKDGQIVIIQYSDPIPNTPFAVRQNLPATMKTAIKTILLATGNDADYIGAQDAYYVDPSADLKLARLDNFYDGLRDIAKLLKLDLKSMK